MTDGRAVVSVDFETCSTIDLTKTGSDVYARHPSTQVFCAAARWPGEDQVVGYKTEDELLELKEDLEQHIELGGAISGWNAGGFEAEILEHVWNIKLPPEQIADTMIQSAYFGLPLNLERAADALRSPFPKDMDGNRLIKRMARPRGFQSDGTPRWWHIEDADKLDRAVAYCMRDVEAESWISENVPGLPQDEFDLWCIDQRMMRAGWRLDMPAVKLLHQIAQIELARLDSEMARLTGGQVKKTTAVQALQGWLRRHAGLDVTDLRKETVGRLLKEGCDAHGAKLSTKARRALEMRRDAGKTSVKKLDRMLVCAGPDDRVRGLTQFYGANRTGRWAGRLVQIQNFPRPRKGSDPDKWIEHPEMFPADARLDAVSDCLRGVFIPNKNGNKLIGADFSQIEARVIAWLAAQTDILQVFAAGADVYTYTAKKVGSDDRQFGKVLVLACGFGIGPGAFLDTAAIYDLILTAHQAEVAVHAWRQANPRIVSLWYEYQRLFEAALATPGSAFTCGRGLVTFKLLQGPRLRGTLAIRLPSGRCLYYREAGRDKEGLHYWQDEMGGWRKVRTYGGKLAENVTQAIARDLIGHTLRKLVSTRRLPAPLIWPEDIRVTIHDEIILEVRDMWASEMKQDVENVMKKAPAWAKGLPIGCEAEIRDRFGK